MTMPSLINRHSQLAPLLSHSSHARLGTSKFLLMFHLEFKTFIDDRISEFSNSPAVLKGDCISSNLFQNNLA